MQACVAPTATAQDRNAAEKLAGIAGVELQSFGMEVLRAGSRFTDMQPEEIIRYDLKEFQIGEYRVSISQVSVMGAAELLVERVESLQAALAGVRQKDGFDLALLMLTDVLNETTHLLYAGKSVGLLRSAFGEEDAAAVFVLPGTLSRKKQVVPPLVEAARQEE